MKFAWDGAKARSNLRKHGLSFHEAATVFGDPLAITYADPDHSQDEDRYLTFGYTNAGKFVVVVHTDRRDYVRIISARRMTRREKKAYQQETR